MALGTSELTGLEVFSTGTDMYMEMTSDSANCCATGLLGEQSVWVFSVSSGTTGIREEQAGNFTLYPNPASSELNMRMSGQTNGASEIRIVDVAGRLVYANSFTATGGALKTLDLHGMQSGTYSVVLTTPNAVKTQRLQVIQ